jgi:transposase
MQWASSYR